jgi:hypothetical protein
MASERNLKTENTIALQTCADHACLDMHERHLTCYIQLWNLSNSGMGWPSKSRNSGLGWGKTTEYLEGLEICV